MADGSIFANPLTWTSVAFVATVGILWKYGWKPATQALDDRAAGIKKQLDEARQLHEEAKALLSDYQRRRANAMKEAEGIVVHAREESERITAKARQDLQGALDRKVEAAKFRISQAEASAIQEVRAAAAELAVAAARQLVAAEFGPAHQASLIDKVVNDIDRTGVA